MVFRLLHIKCNKWKYIIAVYRNLISTIIVWCYVKVYATLCLIHIKTSAHGDALSQHIMQCDKLWCKQVSDTKHKLFKYMYIINTNLQVNKTHWNLTVTQKIYKNIAK